MEAVVRNRIFPCCHLNALLTTITPEPRPLLLPEYHPGMVQAVNLPVQVSQDSYMYMNLYYPGLILGWLLSPLSRYPKIAQYIYTVRVHSIIPKPPPPPPHTHTHTQMNLVTGTCTSYSSLGTRPSKNRKGVSGKRGGVEVYTSEC